MILACDNDDRDDDNDGDDDGYMITIIILMMYVYLFVHNYLSNVVKACLIPVQRVICVKTGFLEDSSCDELGFKWLVRFAFTFPSSSMVARSTELAPFRKLLIFMIRYRYYILMI